MDRKTEIVRFLVTPTERRVLEQLSARDLSSVSNTLRGLIREAAKSGGLWPTPTVQCGGSGKVEEGAR